VKVAEVAPSATSTVAGTCTAESVDKRATETPPVGAADASFTVPVDDVPPTTELGANVIDPKAIRRTNNVDTATVPSTSAEINDARSELTRLVVNGKVTDVEPAGTVTVAGTLTDGSSDVRVTTTPPVAATADKLTVPTAPLPPVTTLGAIVNVLGPGTSTTTELATDWPESVLAVTVAEDSAVTIPA